MAFGGELAAGLLGEVGSKIDQLQVVLEAAEADGFKGWEVIAALGNARLGQTEGQEVVADTVGLEVTDLGHKFEAWVDRLIPDAEPGRDLASGGKTVPIDPTKDLGIARCEDHRACSPISLLLIRRRRSGTVLFI